MPRWKDNQPQYLPSQTDRKFVANQNRIERPYVCWAAVIAVSVLSGALGYILASNYCAPFMEAIR